MEGKRMKKLIGSIFLTLLIISIGWILKSKLGINLSDYIDSSNNSVILNNSGLVINSSMINSEEIPEYSGSPYIEINNNIPYIAEDATLTEFEIYSELDELGRCGVAYANISKYTLPIEEREDIASIKPSGWQSIKYDNIKGKYLYNRCHLIGHQLAGEDDNELNLITGTRYLNIDGMLPFENMIADYVQDTGNHVLYKVTPDFRGNELLCRGLFMEGYSVEDDGLSISFNVYCYNVQPGINIDYMTGNSSLQ